MRVDLQLEEQVTPSTTTALMVNELANRLEMTPSEINKAVQTIKSGSVEMLTNTTLNV